jgi:glycosyltransferase involved in cell wall biosynthesis
MNSDQTHDLVSVVITCYNQAHFLGDAIESTLAQTYPCFEIIVVDDGSTDDAAAVVARYPNVRYIRQQNQGVSAARNRGARASTGDYLVFLDGDDRLRPNALETGLRWLKAHPECAFVSGHCAYIAPDGSHLPTPAQSHVDPDHYAALLRQNYIWLPAVAMHRRAAFEAVGGFNTVVNKTVISNTGDYDLYLRIARQFPVGCHTEVVAEYRRHGTNTSHNTAMMLKASLTVLRAQLSQVKGNNRYEEAYRAGLRKCCAFYGGNLINEASWQLREPGKRKQAIRNLLLALWFYPEGFRKRASERLSRIALNMRKLSRSDP